MEQDLALASEAWVNAGGLILILVGLSILVLEFVVPSYGLFGFAGAATLLIGLVQLHQTGYIEELPISPRMLTNMASIGAILAGFGGYQMFRLYKRRNTTGMEAMIGEKVYVAHWRGKGGRVNIKGEDWLAYSDEKLDLKRNSLVTVSKVDGLKIKISHIESNE